MTFAGALPRSARHAFATFDELVYAHDGVRAFSEQTTLGAADVQGEDAGAGEDDGAGEDAGADGDGRLHVFALTLAEQADGDGVDAGAAAGGGDGAAVLGGKRVVGYACVNQTVASAEIAVAPSWRRCAVGSALVQWCRSAGGRHVWAHGDLLAARKMAESLALTADRRLLHMGYELAGVRPPSAEQNPVAQRMVSCADLVGSDASAMRDFARAWTAVNSAAFAHHREQGALREADFMARTAEEWFDPHLLWVVVRGESEQWRGSGFAAYLWLKPQVDPQEIEVYAIGVAPAAQGQGLGGGLMAWALEAMRERYSRMTLYVDGGTPAERLYRRLGFVDKHVDVQYALG